MSDEEKKPDSPSIPAWQRTQSTDESENMKAATEANETATADAQSSSSEPQSSNEEALAKAEPKPTENKDTTEKKEEDSLTVARRFLDDEDVRSAPRPKKVAFLQSKGISASDIETLVGQDETTHREDSTDRAPIVTYPEFLSKPKLPGSEPLITPGIISTTLQASAVLATTVYGLSRFVLSPMLENLTEARQELHSTAADKLDTLVEKLESSVSHIPAVTPKQPRILDADRDDDGYSEVEDPTEMFHRDVGTQVTSPILSPAGEPEEAEHDRQANRLKDLTKRLKDLNDGIVAQSEDIGDVKTLIDVFRDDLDALTYRGAGSDYMGGYYGGYSGRKEPDDEIRKARDNIRRVKGVLLSSRSFPTSAR